MKKPSGWSFEMQNTEHRIQNTDKGQGAKLRQKNAYSFSPVCGLCSVLCALFLIGCATPAAKLPPPPPKYVDQAEDPEERSSLNSLWSDSANLFEDRKAQRLNDLVTINIDESFSGSGKADTDTSRESSIDYELANFLGMNNDFNLQNAFGVKDLYKGANVFDPAVKSTLKSAFKGKGDTNREGTLVATITAKVVEVMPNGNLVLEARKELTINSEKQILVLTGMARPDDISSDNTILSSKIADAQVYYVGDGVIQEKQTPGWMARALDYVWPF
ncbi:MAG TPA: flagellar basal body L-ring protein FlgH [Nitrospirae bacterium]|nr:flagellar basal body L-ring protein FlgH [Nitrospirota bacterium]